MNPMRYRHALSPALPSTELVVIYYVLENKAFSKNK